MYFLDTIQLFEDHFESPKIRREHLSEWSAINLQAFIYEAPDKPKIDNFESLLKRLMKNQPGLDHAFRTEATLRDRILLACEDIQECELAILKPSPALQGGNSVGWIELLEEQYRHTMAEATVATTSVALTKAPIFSTADPPIMANNPLETRSATSAEK
ncbi:hypothetical protein BGT96224_A21507 [Blumeria graminis f. sp. tritici 96224]|uniref:Uncharacterized protein n=1 Tax=Blumeria graminis f. sp. tritici 96224 TaxID=1268274 RepID=A0A656KN98_BLUGR|nr:hypothetical protein BGT96224_A21507 [Blumeria graminis f. sp. tritici 96224]